MQKYFEAPKYTLIYVFRINDKVHEGCLKIGETSLDDDDVNILTLGPNASVLNKAARKRINEYTQTAGIAYDLLYTESAVYLKGKGMGWFNDKEVHQVLLRSGIKRKTFKGVDNQGTEWFITDLETVKRAINAVKQGRKSLASAEVTTEQSPIIFRPEQQEAIDKTLKQFKKGNQMLWNAKMRFGKTLSALQVVKKMNIDRTLILTHRPVVDKGWFEDFGKIFYDTPDYLYGSKTNGESFSNIERLCKQQNKHYVYFASMQDLRGSETVGGKFNKNDEIFSTPWNLIIVDEAHEGTQTALGKAVMEELVKKETKVLRLSGTPFNLLEDFKEEEIYTWDYVMEQRAKAEWDLTHYGDPNPYAGLPRLNIYTYDLGRLMADFADEDIAFNFREFFRTNDSGSFIHENDVRAFLNLLVKDDEEIKYPYSNQKFRDIFRHTLWMVPGVKAAKALSIMLKSHPVFGVFNVVNVAGDGDEEEANEEALRKVENAIGNNPDETYTITISCGRLTTGVSVKPWTGVLMLSGSYNTAASAYMQTIFRVQTPATINGRVKEDCYVFDFAPDRTLQVLATVPRVSTKAGKTTDNQKRALGEFLNFCPVISIEGSKMKEMDVTRMLQQLKKAYVERVVRNGFEDSCLYNDELMKLSDVEIDEFNDLKGIIGQTKAMAKTNSVDVNNQGLTNEEYEEKEKLEKKKKKELTEEEKKRLEELNKKRKLKEDAISILRGISIRMPLLIYGADITDEDKELTIDNFTQLVDAPSWEEFMPRGVTKQKFNAFKKYYDPEIFSAAGKRIRAMARAADKLTVEERIARIAAIFNTFRNPDKETVLTPWRVVNMHLGDCLGGFCFFDKDYKETIEEPRYIEHAKVTDDVFSSDSRLLEINSKSGLYPLYLAYNIYRRQLKELMYSPETLEEHQAIWDKVIAENIFVICKTPMAKRITQRTLLGFRRGKTNMWAPEDLINKIKNQPELFIERVHKLVGKDMKIKAIVGNPPYQSETDGAGRQAIPLYNLFVSISKSIDPQYISMIMPSRWFAGGMGLDIFRDEMMKDKHISQLYDYVNAKDCFPNISISGGICYFLRNNNHNGKCNFYNIRNGNKTFTTRYLDEFDVVVRYNEAIDILRKIKAKDTEYIDSIISPLMPFGLSTNVRGRKEKSEVDNLRLFASDSVSYISKKEVTKGENLIPKYKIFMSKMSAEHAGEPDRNGMFSVFTKTMKIAYPNDVCTHSYFVIGAYDNEDEAKNTLLYLRTKFVRFIVSITLSAVNLSKLVFFNVPLQQFAPPRSDIDWSKSIEEIDQQLYVKYGLSEEEIAFIEAMIKPM